MADLYLSGADLAFYLKGKGFAGEASALLDQQKNSWEMLRLNYEALGNVRVKTFDFGAFQVKVQFNPGRMTSSSAKVDAKSISERKCFLCRENLPPDHRGILYREKFILLCNPFPIFRNHFTIPRIEHIEQSILPHFEDFYHLAKDLSPAFSVFYNGPKCGASAPDHMHFQAGERGFLPVEREIGSLLKRSGQEIVQNGSSLTAMIEGYLRHVLYLESDSLKETVSLSEKMYNMLQDVFHTEEEPLLNIIAYYDEDRYKVIFFPRERHRPSQYFIESEEKILLSPASVDIGGICITPREQDFEKISSEDIEDIFWQVSISPEKWYDLKSIFRKGLS